MKHERLSWDDYFMGVANLISKRSTCCRIQVGCVLVSVENKIISTGYNGVTKDAEHCYEYFRVKHEKLQDLFPDGKLEDFNDLSWNSYVKSNLFKNEHKLFSMENEVHAEANALLGNSFQEMKNSTMYTTLSPCEDCAKLMKAAGVCRIVCKEIYDRDEGQMALSFLKRNGVTVSIF